jgi:FtsP/CotA-like multicopper oxidase with cupredoxin domain
MLLLAWRINDIPGDPATKPLFSVKRGTPVVLALANRTPAVQSLHLHGHAFRLLHALDDGWEPYFLDTVQIPENRTVRIAFEANNPGRWMLASTVLERFDGGLWTWFEVS